MNILGLHTFGHDTGAALISEGRLMAIGEERLNRMKHSGAFPHKSIEYLLKAAGLEDISRIDLIVGVTRIGKDGKNKEIDMIRSELGYTGAVETISHHTSHAASAFYPSPFEEAAVILNTSYNIAGEPVVETPEDALRCFMSTEMDYLVLEDYLVEAAGPKKFIGGPVIDEDKLKATDVRNGFWGHFKDIFKGKP